MEALFAYAYLWAFGFCSMQEYNACLDKIFLEAPDNELLLELEDCSNNYKETFLRLKRYLEYEASYFSFNKFGRVLFNGLEKAYNSNTYDIKVFFDKCYKLWRMLPDFLSNDLPFFILSYAGDPLSYECEKQTREIYDTAFDFYK